MWKCTGDHSVEMFFIIYVVFWEGKMFLHGFSADNGKVPQKEDSYVCAYDVFVERTF